MPDPQNPWRLNEPPQNSGGNGRLLVWLLLLGAIGLGVWELSLQFPGALDTGSDRARLYYLVAVLTLVSSGVVMSRRIRFGEAVRNIVIWAAIAVVLVVGYGFRNELNDVWSRVRSELVPGEPLSTGAKEIAVSRSADGHFYVFGEANGKRLRFLIDTGATDTVISPADAERIGIPRDELNFTRPYGTANGVGMGAPYAIALLTVGPIEIADMPVAVNQADMDSSLLGMSFLTRLASFEVRGDQMFLRQR